MGVAIDLPYRAVTTGRRVGLYCVGHYSTYYKPMGLYCVVQYSTYYKLKPMGDLPYISSEQGELIIRTELIYELPRPIPIQAEEGGGLIIRTIQCQFFSLPINVFVIMVSHSNLYG